MNAPLLYPQIYPWLDAGFRRPKANARDYFGTLELGNAYPLLPHEGENNDVEISGDGIHHRVFACASGTKLCRKADVR